MASLRLGEALPQAETQVALDLLAEQQFLDGLPALLPERVWHGNKTGEQPGLRHDMALVEHAGRWAGCCRDGHQLSGAGTTGTMGTTGSTVAPPCLPTFANIGAAVGNWVIGTGRTDALPGPHRP